MKYVSGVYYLRGNDDTIATAAQFNHVVKRANFIKPKKRKNNSTNCSGPGSDGRL